MSLTTIDQHEAAWPVILADPVNRAHPLNQSRVAWWLTLPGWDGGAKWYDLMGLWPGTLTGLGSSEGWRSTTRPGGWGHLQGAGGTAGGYVALMPSGSAPLNLAAGQSASIACWYRCSSVATATLCLVGASGTQTFGIFQNPASGNNSVYGALVDSTGTTLSMPANGTGIDNNWHRALCVLDRAAGKLLLYLDGLQVNSTAITTNTGTVTPAAPMNAMQWSGDANRFAGSLDDLPYWLRALTAADARADYDLGRRGYPGVLRRQPPPMFHSGVVGAAIAPLALHHARLRRVA